MNNHGSRVSNLTIISSLHQHWVGLLEFSLLASAIPTIYASLVKMHKFLRISKKKKTTKQKEKKNQISSFVFHVQWRYKGTKVCRDGCVMWYDLVEWMNEWMYKGLSILVWLIKYVYDFHSLKSKNQRRIWCLIHICQVKRGEPLPISLDLSK